MVTGLCRQFDKLKWKWAKTYEKSAPHWYSKRLENKDYFLWEFLMQIIDYQGKKKLLVAENINIYIVVNTSIG